jgi:hypothetical protein
MSTYIEQVYEFLVIGDGVSTTFSYDCAKPPFTSPHFSLLAVKIEFIVGLPSSVFLYYPTDGTTVSISGSVISMTFPTAPAVGFGVDTLIGFRYNSL